MTPTAPSSVNFSPVNPATGWISSGMACTAGPLVLTS
jgi:hypothetical protein